MKKLTRGLYIALVVALSITAALAQEFRGSISGRITDPNGAAVVGATVTVKNTGTNVTNNVQTGEDGSYLFPFLLPGSYTVTAVSSGFKTSAREGIQLNVDAKLTLDIQLEIGTQAEVQIIADQELVEKGSVTTGLVISQRQVEELPQPEGAVFTLVTQSPGINYTGNPQFTGPTANGNLAAFRSNGAGGNQINLDGSPNLAFAGQVAFTPPGDAVQEFKVQTNSFDAQQGFTAGSTVNVALKSGTNKLHGSAYYFDRNRSRTANNFFNNRIGQGRAFREYYRYGGQVNGPVFIPKIYDGRNRTFFLFTMERQRDNTPEPTTFRVPTERQRNGDFSEILATTPIFDPATAVTSGANVVRTAFAGNIIPTARLNPIAVNYLRRYPRPNLPVGTDGIGLFFSNMNLIRPYKSYLGRLDHNFNQNHKVFGKYYFSQSDEDRYNWIGTPDAPTRGFEVRQNKGGNIDYTATLSSKVILDIRSSYNEFSQRRLPANPISPADLGFTGAALEAFRGATVIPRFDFASFNIASIAGALGSNRADYNEGLFRPFNLFSVQPTMTQIAGSHTFKYGYDFRRLRENLLSKGFNAGRFQFDGTYTAPASNSSAALRSAYGRDLAAFLLGIPTANATTSIIDNPTEYQVNSNYHGIFFQDDWRLNSKITLNLGLRYELESGVREDQNRLVIGFDQTSTNPLNAMAQANFTASPPASVPAFTVLGGLLFANDQTRANQTTDKNNFQPRVGVSYAVNEKTVIRAGAGIFVAPFQIGAINQAGFSTPTLFVPSTNNGLTFIATLSNPFPNGVAASPGSSQGLATFIGRDVTIASNERKNGQYARFVVGVQRELPWKFGIEANYVYSRGYDLPVTRNLNFIPTQFLNAGAEFSSTVSTFLTANVSNPFRGLVPSNATYNATNIARRNLLTRFSAFGNVNVTEYNGYSTYNALQVQLIKRFTKGLSLNASYTLSREREALTRLNPSDDVLTEQIAANDRPHRITFSSVYELPVGRNRQFGKDMNRVLDWVIGGWQLAANYERQSGEPLLFGNVFFNGDPSTLRSRIGQKDEQGRKYGVDIPAFDITGFYPAGTVFNGGAAPAAVGLGNINTIAGANTLRYFPLSLGNLRNQRFLNFNAGLSKNFRIREGMKFQIRVEAINALNTPYFNSVSLNPANLPNLTSATANNLGRFGFTNGPTRQPPRDFQIGGRFTF
jgi:hypothetical protein